MAVSLLSDKHYYIVSLMRSLTQKIMSRLKVVTGKLALLLSIVSVGKSKTGGNFISLKKASAEEIEKTRCKQYDYAT
jgi:hypothetical protein